MSGAKASGGGDEKMADADARDEAVGVHREDDQGPVVMKMGDKGSAQRVVVIPQVENIVELKSHEKMSKIIEAAVA